MMSAGVVLVCNMLTGLKEIFLRMKAEAYFDRNML